MFVPFVLSSMSADWMNLDCWAKNVPADKSIICLCFHCASGFLKLTALLSNNWSRFLSSFFFGSYVILENWSTTHFAEELCTVYKKKEAQKLTQVNCILFKDLLICVFNKRKMLLSTNSNPFCRCFTPESRATECHLLVWLQVMVVHFHYVPACAIGSFQ